MIAIELPIRTRSESNVREHWACKAKRAKEQRSIVRVAVRLELARLPAGKARTICLIRLTRIGRRLLDSDNLARSFKAIRDGVADALGIDDGSRALTWEYEQIEDKFYGIVITIKERVENE